MIKKKHILLIVALVIQAGCSILPGLQNVDIVKHPDSPMLIQDVSGNKIKVAIYDSTTNTMIEYGWIEIDSTIIGWTITKYNWSKFMEKKANATR